MKYNTIIENAVEPMSSEWAASIAENLLDQVEDEFEWDQTEEIQEKNPDREIQKAQVYALIAIAAAIRENGRRFVTRAAAELLRLARRGHGAAMVTAVEPACAGLNRAQVLAVLRDVYAALCATLADEQPPAGVVMPDDQS